MYATVKDVDNALVQVNTVFSLLNKQLEALEARLAELESKQAPRRSAAKKEESNNDA